MWRLIARCGAPAHGRFACHDLPRQPWTASWLVYRPSRILSIPKQLTTSSRKGVRKRWSTAECDLLLKLRRERLSHIEIATHFPDRTVRAIAEKLHRHICLTKDYFFLPPTRYTESEDAHIRSCMAVGLSAKHIRSQLPHRTTHSIRNRWRTLSLTANRRSMRYSAAEDAKLVRLRSDEDMNWPDIARELGRTAVSVCTRWHLIVKTSRKKRHFYTAADDAKVMAMQARGLSYPKIGSLLTPRRSVESVRNRFCYLKELESIGPGASISSAEQSGDSNHPVPATPSKSS